MKKPLLVQGAIATGVVASLAVGAWAATVRTSPDDRVVQQTSASGSPSADEASPGAAPGSGYGYGWGYGYKPSPGPGGDHGAGYGYGYGYGR